MGNQRCIMRIAKTPLLTETDSLIIAKPTNTYVPRLALPLCVTHLPDLLIIRLTTLSIISLHDHAHQCKSQLGLETLKPFVSDSALRTLVCHMTSIVQ